MRNYIILFLTVVMTMFSSIALIGQDDTSRLKSIGYTYLGELGLRPGFTVDASILIGERQRWVTKQTLYIRPVVGYFIRPFFTHNFVAYPQLVSRSQFLDIEKLSAYYEINGQVGYMRFQFIGDVFQVAPDGSIEEVRFSGDNALILGLGFSLGVTAKNSGIDYYAGFDFNRERTGDALRTNLIFIKVGARLPLNKPENDEKEVKRTRTTRR